MTDTRIDGEKCECCGTRWPLGDLIVVAVGPICRRCSDANAPNVAMAACLAADSPLPGELAALRSENEHLREALTKLVEHFDPHCRFDHHGYCQEHFLESDCSVAKAISALGKEVDDEAQ